MTCFNGDKRKKALVAFVVLVLVQLALVIALLVLGAKGKEEIGAENGPGVPYYIGALVVGSVFAVPVLQIVAVIILSRCEEEYCITSWFGISACILNFFGIIACIIGMVFVIAFGIANCKKAPPEERDYTDIGGFCSYTTNIDTNYTIAVLALVCILIMLPSTCCTFYVFSKYAEKLGTSKESSISSPSSVSPTTYGRGGPGPPVHPAPTAPLRYPPPGTSWQPGLDGSEEPPPSYESVMGGHSSSNQASGSNQTSSHTTSSNTGNQLSLSEQLSRDTQKRMIEDRRRRNDVQDQRRRGVPQHQITRKFIGKFGF